MTWELPFCGKNYYDVWHNFLTSKIRYYYAQHFIWHSCITYYHNKLNKLFKMHEMEYSRKVNDDYFCFRFSNYVNKFSQENNEYNVTGCHHWFITATSYIEGDRTDWKSQRMEYIMNNCTVPWISMNHGNRRNNQIFMWIVTLLSRFFIYTYIEPYWFLQSLRTI